MADEKRWRLQRQGRVGDSVIGGVAGACAQACSSRWINQAERAAVEAFAAERGIDERLAAHLAPRSAFLETSGSDTFERAVGWMEWVSERPEPERTRIIGAFEFYVGFGGDADFRLGGAVRD